MQNSRDIIKIKRNFQQFGKLQINISKLLNLKLYVCYATGSPFGTIKQNQPVSSKFVDILIFIMDTDKLPENEIEMLDMTEGELFDTLMTYSGLKKKYKYKHSRPNIDTLKERFVTIQGLMEGGNDSEILINEAKFILKLLYASDVITEEQYKSIN